MDLEQINRVTPEVIISAFETRYKQGLNFTNARDILVSIRKDGFKTTERDPKAPHPNRVAEIAFSKLWKRSEDTRYIIPTGESGSGKTTTLKLIAKHLTTLTEQDIYDKKESPDMTSGYSSSPMRWSSETDSIITSPISPTSIPAPQELFGWLTVFVNTEAVNPYNTVSRNSAWQTRRLWFSQKNYKLYYFLSENPDNPEGCIDITDIQKVYPFLLLKRPLNNTQNYADSGDADFEIVLKNQVKSWRFQAASSKDKDRWIKGLHQWISYHKIQPNSNSINFKQPRSANASPFLAQGNTNIIINKTRQFESNATLDERVEKIQKWHDYIIHRLQKETALVAGLANLYEAYKDDPARATQLLREYRVHKMKLEKMKKARVVLEANLKKARATRSLSAPRLPLGGEAGDARRRFNTGGTEVKAREMRLEAGLLEDAWHVVEAFCNATSLLNLNASCSILKVKLFFSGQSGCCVGVNFFDIPFCKALVTASLMPGHHMMRNFHIFYYLCYGLSIEEKNLLRLTNAEDYRILSSSAPLPPINTIKSNFDNLRRALCNLGVNYQMQLPLFRILVGLLYFGNVTFQPDPNNATLSIIQNRQAFLAASYLLGIPEQELTDFLLRSSTTTADVIYTRNNLITLIYERLVSWLFSYINKKLEAPFPLTCKVIELIDTPGFQLIQSSTESSSMETFLSNYTSDKLQQFIFKTLINNKLCNPEDQVYLRTEECVQFIEQSLNEGSRCPFPVQKTKQLAPYFMIDHPIGEVAYDFNEFATRNRNAVVRHPNPNFRFFKDEIELLKISKFSFLKNIISRPVDKVAGLNESKSRVATQWLIKVFELFQVLLGSNYDCHSFIFCILPNDPNSSILKRNSYDMNPGTQYKLDFNYVLDQCERLGLISYLESIKKSDVSKLNEKTQWKETMDLLKSTIRRNPQSISGEPIRYTGFNDGDDDDDEEETSWSDTSFDKSKNLNKSAAGASSFDLNSSFGDMNVTGVLARKENNKIDPSSKKDRVEKRPFSARDQQQHQQPQPQPQQEEIKDLDEWTGSGRNKNKNEDSSNKNQNDGAPHPSGPEKTTNGKTERPKKSQPSRFKRAFLCCLPVRSK